MNVSPRRILNEFTPPVVPKIARKLHLIPTAPPDYEYSETWPDVPGWSGPEILAGFEKAWPADVASLSPLQCQPPRIAFGCALAIAAKQDTSLSVLDWGSGLGFYHLLARALRPDLAFDYSCKELPLVAARGAQMHPGVKFYDDDSALESKYDFVLVSSSLQYSQDWAAALAVLARATSGHLFVTRMPMVQNAGSFIATQRAYGTIYPGWNLNRNEFVGEAEKLGLKLIQEFDLITQIEIYRAPEQPRQFGYLFSS